MDDTGYKCPKCGQEDEFFADVVVAMFYGCRISADGWDYFGYDGEVNTVDGTTFTCEKCGYEAPESEFAVPLQ